MDDGRRNLLGLIDDGPTGTGQPDHGERDYHGPGRGAGNSINALLDGWLLSGRRRYLDKAEALIRRTIHPDDDIAARELLDDGAALVVHGLPRRPGALPGRQGRGRRAGRHVRLRPRRPAGLRGLDARARGPLLRPPRAARIPDRDLGGPGVPQGQRPAAGRRARRRAAPRAAARAGGTSWPTGRWADLLRFESRDVARSVAILLREATRDASFRVLGAAPAPRPPEGFDFGAPDRFVDQKGRVLAQLRTAPGAARAVLRLIRSAVGRCFPR